MGIKRKELISRIEDLEQCLDELIQLIYTDVWGQLESKEMFRKHLLWRIFPQRYGMEKCVDVLYKHLYVGEDYITIRELTEEEKAEIKEWVVYGDENDI